MRIVNRAAFLALPAGTLYNKYEPCVFGDLCIKDDTCTGAFDWLYVHPSDAIDAEGTCEFVDMLDAAQASGAELPLDLETVSRDGMFDEAQLFAVWSQEDVALLIARLQRCLGSPS